MSAQLLLGRALRVPASVRRSSGGHRLVTQARRTVAEKFKTKNEPNWVLDEPKREWEIGGRYVRSF